MLLFPFAQNRDLLITDSEESAIAFAANRFLITASQSIDDHGSFSVALSGGNTPKKLYEAILHSEKSKTVAWSKVHVFFSDERAVPPDHPESNYNMAMHSFSKEPLSHAKIYRMEADAKNLDAAAKRYEQLIQKNCFEGRVDLILLGVGEDGHTASLFPNTEALTCNDLVSANYVPQKNSYRMTLTLDCIQNARKIICLVLGTSKASIMKELFFSEQGQAYPAAKVGSGRASILYILDKGAASLFPEALLSKVSC